MPPRPSPRRYARRIPGDGLRARSARGPIGDTWWSRRFVDALEALGVSGRLERGKLYARQGQVLSLDLAPGVVSARVQGSRAHPYVVRIAIPVLSKRDWGRAQQAIASRAAFTALLLAGEMPQDIGEALADCKLSLFPTSPRDLRTDCTCPDTENPCKHIAAVLYLLAERFDQDPFLIFRWRGRDRDALLEPLRPRGGEEDPPLVPFVDLPQLRERIASFWEAGPSLDEPGPRPIAVTLPHAILLSLDPSGVELDGLEDAYAAIVSSAHRLRAGD